MSSIEEIKRLAPEIVTKYAVRSNTRGMIQVLNTFIPFFALFYLALVSLAESPWLATLYILLIALFIVRIFMLMHDCGHKSLFRTQSLNAFFGFFTGVFCGMPQYVWAQHHNYHHATNGNWDKYTGPLATITVDAFAKLPPNKQKSYEYTRHIFASIPGAFLYFIFNPRFNWALGTVKALIHIVKTKRKQPAKPLKAIAGEFKTRYWADGAEYWHMFGNNVVLLGIWWAASAYFGAGTFFTVYLSSLTLAGAAGIIIFTIQHNFEHSYASDDAHWDYYQAAVSGTSFLKLPRIVNWFSADIAYHHFHHLSARIPNYNLAACQKEYGHLFDEVTQIRLQDIPRTFKYILWDRSARRIITIKEYRDSLQAAAA